jgi:glycosyltransferase involved in cell wall biosynthesis
VRPGEEAAVPVAITIAVLCRSDEPCLGRTMVALAEAARRLQACGRQIAFSICVNGGPGPAHQAAKSFAAAQGEGRVMIGTLERADKAAAWNWARARCSTPWIAFCDADVEPEPDALVRLAEALERSPGASVASARLVAELSEASLVARAASLPHRFDFHVVRGPLYLLRAKALEQIPEGLLLEDAWISAELGSDRIVSVPEAVVAYRPAATLGDYFRERIRTEAGKMQIHDLRRRLGRPATAIARYPWKAMLSGVGPSDWPLVVFNLGVRIVARVGAWITILRGRQVVWVSVASTKLQSSQGAARAGDGSCDGKAP